MAQLSSALITLAAGLTVLSALLYWYQPRMVFFPFREIEATPTDIGLDFEEVSMSTADGETLAGWFVPAPQSRATLLFLHGNAGNISHRLQSINIFHRLGLSVFIFDYRGYGNSTGKPSEEGLYRDAETAWQYLAIEKGIASEELIVFGRSLGGVLAAHLAAAFTPRACILESVFTSAPDMAASAFPFLPARLLCRYRFDALAAVRRVFCPLLVVHSPEDDIVPYRQGRLLFEAAPGKKVFLAISGDHNTGFLLSGSQYTTGLAGFLNEI